MVQRAHPEPVGGHDGRTFGPEPRGAVHEPIAREDAPGAIRVRELHHPELAVRVRAAEEKHALAVGAHARKDVVAPAGLGLRERARGSRGDIDEREPGRILRAGLRRSPRGSGHRA